MMPKTAAQRLTDEHGKKKMWVSHDLARGKAAARRRRQMAAGILPRICERCGVTVVPKSRANAVCDPCLAELQKEWQRLMDAVHLTEAEKQAALRTIVQTSQAIGVPLASMLVDTPDRYIQIRHGLADALGLARVDADDLRDVYDRLKRTIARLESSPLN